MESVQAVRIKEQKTNEVVDVWLFTKEEDLKEFMNELLTKDKHAHLWGNRVLDVYQNEYSLSEQEKNCILETNHSLYGTLEEECVQEGKKLYPTIDLSECFAPIDYETTQQWLEHIKLSDQSSQKQCELSA